MWALVLYFGVIGIAPPIGSGLPAAPLDIEIGRQTIALRQPLIARTAGVRLHLYVRDVSSLPPGAAARNEDFEAALPAGSVTAYLRGTDGEKLTLSHQAYSFFRGYMGLVLTESAERVRRNTRFTELELEAKVPLRGVRLVWIDRAGRRIEDAQPSL
jgi:hypothetical protein